MKKILFIAFLIATTFLSASAQTTSGHLLFKGIPIDGKISPFVTKLQQKGFEIRNITDSDKILFDGKLSGEDVILRVDATPTSHTVYCVFVFFQPREKWADLELFYNNLTSSYINKYGEPFVSKHEFQSPYDNPSSTSQMFAVEEGKCNYSSSFNAEHGIIDVDISNLKRVRAIYTDAANFLLYNKELQDDI